MRQPNLEGNNEKNYSFEELLDRDGVFAYTNIGVSMLPLLRENKDIIEIIRKGPERCNKYDVVLYKRGNRYILHRIVKVLSSGYYIVGDNCVRLEKDITDDKILGVMTRIVRDGKTISVDDFWYKVYIHLWCDVYPVRFFILKVKRFVYRCLRFVKRRIFKIQN